MEAVKKLISKDSLGKLYEKIKASGKTMVAPAAGYNGKTEFVYDPAYKDVCWDHIQTAQSVKNLVFPKIENLCTFTSDREGITITDIDRSKIKEVVAWGIHPCDAAGFDALKSIFKWESIDTFFTERLEKLVVIGLSCQKADEFCFCTSVGLSPDSKKGSDILLTPLKNGDFLAEILTEKGQKIMEVSAELFANAPSEEDKVVASLPQTFSQAEVTEKLKSKFDSHIWVTDSLRCLGCGACAFVCPACACFDIQDETHGKDGKRLRCWDSCGFSLFTLHTSCHNPREVQSQRWRQRIMHKFSYMPERNESLGCLGCGRCSRACPVDMNIQEQLIAIEKA